MAAVAPHLDLTVDYGWLWFISQPLFAVEIHPQLPGNWGFDHQHTFIVRGIMYPRDRKRSTPHAMKMRTPCRRFSHAVSVWAH